MVSKLSRYFLIGATFLSCTSVLSATTFSFTSSNYGPYASSIPNQTVSGTSVTETGFWASVDNSGASLVGATNKFAATDIAEYSGAGLGVCNPSEQTSSSCAAPQHQIDNYNGLDFVLFSFSAAVSLNSVSVAGFGNPTGVSGSYNDVDLSYAVLTAPQAALLNAGTLAFNSVNFTTMSTNFYGSYNYSLSGTGQYLLIGAAVTPYWGDTSDKATPDAFKIQTLSVTATPEPATFLLLGSGFLAIAAFSFRRAKKAV